MHCFLSVIIYKYMFDTSFRRSYLSEFIWMVIWEYYMQNL